MIPHYTHVIFLLLVALAFGVGAFVYPSLPAEIASHWNAAGEADGYMPKFWGIFLFPLLMLGLYGAYALLPKIDPLGKNIEGFRKYYDFFWLLMVGFFAYLYTLSIAWNLGHEFDFTRFMIPAVAVLLYCLGVVIRHSKRNWFVGIRTPWTLSSDRVWDKTHAFGGTLFKIAAGIALLGMIAPSSMSGIVFIAAPVGVSALICIVYSYLVYRKEK